MKINALTVCKSLYKCLDKQYSVKNKELSIGLIPFQTIYALLLRMSKCRKCFKEKTNCFGGLREITNGIWM